jgi:hypothetical protein
MHEFVIDAWCMVVPKRVAAAHLGHAPAARATAAEEPGQ